MNMSNPAIPPVSVGDEVTMSNDSVWTVIEMDPRFIALKTDTGKIYRIALTNNGNYQGGNRLRIASVRKAGVVQVARPVQQEDDGANPILPLQSSPEILDEDTPLSTPDQADLYLMGQALDKACPVPVVKPQDIPKDKEGDEALAKFVVASFGLLTRLKEMVPWVQELRLRFELRGGVEKRPIMGCDTWTQFCEKFLHYTPRRIQQLLKEAVEKAMFPDSPADEGPQKKLPLKKQQEKKETPSGKASICQMAKAFLEQAEPVLEKGRLEKVDDYQRLIHLNKELRNVTLQISQVMQKSPMPKLDAEWIYAMTVSNLSASIQQFKYETTQGIPNAASAKDIFMEFKKIMQENGWRWKTNYEFVRLPKA